jgi:hypothetical protein
MRIDRLVQLLSGRSYTRPLARERKFWNLQTNPGMRKFLNSNRIPCKVPPLQVFVLSAVVFSFLSSQNTFAQASVMFPATLVNGVGSVLSIPVTMQTTGLVDHIEVLTQGTQFLDFTASGISGCVVGTTYTQGQTCNVSVRFSPRYPGIRLGAVVILTNSNQVITNQSDQVIASQSLSGIGTGPLSVMIPGEINTLAGDGCLSDAASCPGSGNKAATESALNLPQGATTDGAGNLYISDTGNNRIRKVDSSGGISTITGSEVPGFAGDGGWAETAQISNPSSIAIDGAGNVILADTGNNAIRKIWIIDGRIGNISTIAGSLGTAGYTGDGMAATSAQLSSPHGLAFDLAGNLYVADTGNNVIRKIDTSGNIATVAGNGTAGYSGDLGTPLSAQFYEPWGVTVAPDGSVYIADFGNNRIRLVDATWTSIKTVAGDGTGSYTGDRGPAVNSTLNGPASVATDAAGNLYIADSENNAIRKVNALNGHITTIAGNGTAFYGGDGAGATLAGLYKPYSVVVDGAGNLFLSDRLDLRIREISGNEAEIQYPTMKEGKISAPIAQILENDGNTVLNISSLAASPATTNAELDSTPTDPITTSCSISHSLAIDAACVLAVEFAPVVIGAPQTGLLSVTSDSANSPSSVDLSGIVLSVDPSSTTVISSLNPAAVGLAVNFVAHIASPNHVTGTVQFFDGTARIGIPQQVNPSTDTATITTSFSVLQSHTITAAYSGDNLNAASNPNNPLVQLIEQATVLNVIPSANPVVEFAPVTFAASLSGWMISPVGAITFSEGSTVLGSASLNGYGAASFVMPSLAVGRHMITAVFAGDSNDFASQYQFAETITLAPSSTSLVTSSAVIQFSTPITLVATVTGVPASTPTGNVEFKDGATVLATVPVNSSGIASYTNTTLAAGIHMITAVYQGNANYVSSTSTQTVTETIWQTATNVLLSESTSSSIWSHIVTFTATVTASGGSIPTGTITFMYGNLLVGTGALNRGVASFSTSMLPIGTDDIIAIYGGDANDSSSKSAAQAVTVMPAPTTTAISSSQNPLLTLSPVTISASVSNGGTALPTGLVTFSEDSVPLGVTPLNSSGVAILSLPFLTAGSHTFRASYAGDPLDLASSSAPLVEVVQLRTTTNVLTTSETSLTGGQQITLISITDSSGSVSLTGPTGTVTFTSGNITLATTPVGGDGVATVTVLLPGTSAALSSSYSGDANYAASVSTSQVVTIGPPPDFSIMATPSSWQMQSKQHLSVKVSLASAKTYADTLILGCSGLPRYATCTFSQGTEKMGAGSEAEVDVVVDTGSPLTGGTQARTTEFLGAPVVMACLLPGCLGMGLFSLRRERHRLLGVLCLFTGLFVMSSCLSGCGSIQNSGTSPGVYNFLITATSSTGESHYVDMTMTLTQ